MTSSYQKGLSVELGARETRVVHKDGRKFLMEVDVAPSAPDIIKQSSAHGKQLELHTAHRAATTRTNEAGREGQLFLDDMPTTQSRDLQHLKMEIMREQQKLLNVVEQQGAVIQDMHSRLQHQQLSPVKPSQPKRHPVHIRSSELDGPAARHLKYEYTRPCELTSITWSIHACAIIKSVISLKVHNAAGRTANCCKCQPISGCSSP